MQPTRTTARNFRTDLLIAAVLPLIILTLGVAATSYSISRLEREARVIAKLDTVASFLVGASELGLLTQAPDLLRDPVLRAVADQDIVHVSLYSPSGQVLIEQGESVGYGPSVADLRATRLGPRYRPLDSTLYELSQVVNYRIEDEGAEVVGLFRSDQPTEKSPSEKVHGYVRIVMSSERVAAEYRDRLKLSAASTAVVLAIGVTLALLLSRRTAQGITLLSRALQRVGQGHFDVDVPELGSGEISQLGRGLNEMSAQLREARDEIDQHQLQLERKVHERTAELNATRIEAERANQAKSRFLANMSHEIRTPMTAILGYADVMIDDPRTSDDQRELLNIIGRNGNHLLAIINRILDLSKIEAGRLQVEKIPIDLVELIVDVGQAMRIRADERGIALNVEFASDVPALILSDSVRVRQAVINLVENAIKFTGEGSVIIRLTYEAPSETARIDVIDTGVGIPEEAITNLFLQFEQADTSTSRRFGGTGLGLAITVRLAHLLGGECKLESEVGIGTQATFSFSAPRAPGAKLRKVSQEDIRRVEEQSALPEKGKRISAHILLVEDGADNQRLIAMILRKAGAEVEVVEDGLAALDAMRSDAPFDLVLMDMAMPVMDGYTATRTLREMGFETPIIALTAHALTGEREKCIAAGCDDYATKPIDKPRLLELVRHTLEAADKPDS